MNISYPWTRSTDEILQELQVDKCSGLSKKEVEQRRRQYGLNKLPQLKTRSWLAIFLEQFRSVIILLLGLATAVSFIFGDYIEGIAIAVVILLNTAIGFFTELSAVRSMEALRKLGETKAWVRRAARNESCNASELVPGDIVLIEAGTLISADMRILKASRLRVDESSLTGESLPIDKQEEPVDKQTPLAERNNMLYRGTIAVHGTAIGVVVATGRESELGQITHLVETAQDEITPLEKRLARLAHKLVWVTLGIAALTALLGIATGKPLFLMIETSIALAVAAVPEGLPIVATLALARGMQRMARRNALINYLSAVETLGSVNLIFTDKTGTLTENAMHLHSLSTWEGEYVGESEGDATSNAQSTFCEALAICALCNSATLTEKGKGTGDPMEVALLQGANDAGITVEDLEEEWTEEREEPFDPAQKMMAKFHRKGDRLVVRVKGAPDAVLEVCEKLLTDNGTVQLTEEDKRQWFEKNEKLASEGLRLLALALKEVSSVDDEPYGGLTLVGLVGLMDPPRPDVADALEQCRGAGIRVIIVTGDQQATAINVAKQIGLFQEEDDPLVIHGRDIIDVKTMDATQKERYRKADLFARVDPKQKLDLIVLHQQAGAIVAMTGDGVNDAPALKKADIGIAMGQRGTDVARQASDVILTDDSFATISVAVAQGRAIFDNIRKFVVYLMSCNLSELLVVGLAALGQGTLPILPLQILFLNLVTDVFPALALGLSPGDKEIMKRPPRPAKEQLIERRQWKDIIAFAVLITCSTLISFGAALYILELEEKEAVTVSFLVLAFAQLWHVFNMSERSTSYIDNEVTRNKYIWYALILCVILLFSAVYLPLLASLLNTVSPSSSSWLLICIGSIIPLLGGYILRKAKMLS